MHKTTFIPSSALNGSIICITAKPKKKKNNDERDRETERTCRPMCKFAKPKKKQEIKRHNQNNERNKREIKEKKKRKIREKENERKRTKILNKHLSRISCASLSAVGYSFCVLWIIVRATKLMHFELLLMS